MKNRLHDKKAGIFITSILFIISLGETIIRALQPDYLHAYSNFGETLSIAIFTALILFFSSTKKDRLCYICYGVFIGWFVLEETLSVPNALASLSNAFASMEFNATVSTSAPVAAIAFGILNVLIKICIVAIGALMIEYMNDGTIYNRAFNVLCFATILLLLISVIASIHGLILGKAVELVLFVLNNIYRITMVFLFTFLAYDSAKKQLSKVNFDK